MWFQKMLSAFNVVTADTNGAIDGIVTHRTGTWAELHNIRAQASVSEIGVVTDHNAMIVFDGAGGYKLNAGGASIYEGGCKPSTSGGQANLVPYGEDFTTTGIDLINPIVGGWSATLMSPSNANTPKGDYETFGGTGIVPPGFLAAPSVYKGLALYNYLTIKLHLDAIANINDGETLTFWFYLVDADTGEFITVNFQSSSSIVVTAAAGKLVADGDNTGHTMVIPVDGTTHHFGNRTYSELRVHIFHSQVGGPSQGLGQGYVPDTHASFKLTAAP